MGGGVVSGLSDTLRHAVDTPLIGAARLVAEVVHSGDRYGDAPYMHHLEQVAQLVFDCRGEIGERWPWVVAMAFLHDAIEDHPGCASLIIAHHLGPIVPQLKALAKRGDQTSAEYFLAVTEAGQDAIAVKLADRICNIRACIETKPVRVKLVDRYSREHSDVNNMRTAGGLPALWRIMDHTHRQLDMGVA